MITTTLGDIVADLINRVSFLENSLPGSAMSYHPEEETKPVKVSEEWNEDQWDIVTQLRGEVAYLKRKVTQLEGKGMGRRGGSKY